MAERHRPERGVLDTSVIIDLDELDPLQLPIAVAVSALTHGRARRRPSRDG